jgi:hypothetical protein
METTRTEEEEKEVEDKDIKLNTIFTIIETVWTEGRMIKREGV